jgi:hypothetical protein
LPRELSNVELTLEKPGAIREIEQQWVGEEVQYFIRVSVMIRLVNID